MPYFSSVLWIIELNADLWVHAGPGHVNDMDMLQVGRGMSYEEDKSHFTMWAIMASPLTKTNWYIRPGVIKKARLSLTRTSKLKLTARLIA